MYLLELPHWGDSNEYTQHTIINLKSNYPKFAWNGIFPGVQERVRNSRGKRAISVRATKVLLYVKLN